MHQFVNLRSRESTHQRRPVVIASSLTYSIIWSWFDQRFGNLLAQSESCRLFQCLPCAKPILNDPKIGRKVCYRVLGLWNAQRLCQCWIYLNDPIYQIIDDITNKTISPTGHCPLAIPIIQPFAAVCLLSELLKMPSSGRIFTHEFSSGIFQFFHVSWLWMVIKHKGSA